MKSIFKTIKFLINYRPKYISKMTELIYNQNLIELLKQLNKEYNSNEKLRGVKLNTKQNSHCFLYDVCRGVANSVSKKHMNNFALTYAGPVKMISRKGFVFCMYNYASKRVYTPQVDIPILSGLYTFVMDKIILMKGLSREWASDEMNSFMIQVVTLIMDGFGFKSFTSWISIVMRVYSLILTYSGFRKRNRYEAQIDFADVASSMILLGLPDSVVKAVRDFQTLVSVRIQTGSFITIIMRKLIAIIKLLLKWASDKFESPIFIYVHDTIDRLFSFLKYMEYVDEINEVYSKYIKNSQVILDINYRNKVLELNSKTEVDLEFKEFLSKPDMRASQELFRAFNSNIVKYVKTFTISSRTEPVCFVFEGPPGTRKSALMNQLTTYCKHKNRSVYIHEVPSVEEGKDFYDDYENQDIFVQDDIGQKGNSQWRVIINAVAPVKMPLQCASAEKKMTKFFNSNLLLGTTNKLTDIQSFTSKDCVSDKEALFRRIHVIKFNSTEEFDVSYWKFDYKGSHRWENKFLDGMRDCEEPLKYRCAHDDRRGNLKLISWIYKIIRHAERVNQQYADAGKVTEEELDFIDEECSEYQDAFIAQSVMATVFEAADDVVTNWIPWLANFTKTMLSDIITSLMTPDGLKEAFGLLFCVLVINYIVDYAYGHPQASVSKLMSFRDKYAVQTFEGESEICCSDYVNTSKNHCFFASVSSVVKGKRIVINTQITMSGKYILINDHAVGSNPVLNIYRDWQAYENRNMMFNNLPAIVEDRILSEDLAILRIDKFPVTPMRIYRWPKDEDIDFHRSKELFCVNSDIIKPMKDRGNCYVNSSIVKYSLTTTEYTMYPGSTITYDLSCPGLCGSLLMTEAGIPLGHHIAGEKETELGIIKLWTRATRDRIRKIMSGREGAYDPVFKETSDFSGMRFLQTDLVSSRTLTKSGFKPTAMNNMRDNSELDTIIDKMEELPFVLPRQLKAPANLSAFGKKTLKEMSKKSYRPIPMIKDEEVEFAKKCLASQFVKFKKITYEEAAFGNAELTEMNRKSVNGYGYTKDKKDYIDYDNKIISPQLLERLESFKSRALKDELLVEDVLCVEQLKDELRAWEKVNKPRSYRILPLHHTFLTKQYVAELFMHIKRNMWTNGIAIGMNPYLDFDRMYKVLRTKATHFDGDFGKYDGSAPSQLQDAIVDVVLSFYEGTNDDKKIFKALLDSLIRSYVLTNEELYLTTHSLPSGCWVTALFNSFLNKMLTAICLKRNKPNATVWEWASVADFTLGDDKLVGVPSSLSGSVNALLMREVAESLGMEYTDARKGAITQPSKDLDECQFLKRMFVYHHELKKRVGVLDINTIVETLRFFDSSKEYEEAMDGKMTAIQFELYLYGRYGESLCEYLKEEAREKGIEFKEFQNEQIMKSMTDETTYATLLNIQGKYDASK
jgi:hypothetical protein